MSYSIPGLTDHEVLTKLRFIRKLLMSVTEPRVHLQLTPEIVDALDEAIGVFEDSTAMLELQDQTMQRRIREIM